MTKEEDLAEFNKFLERLEALPEAEKERIRQELLTEAGITPTKEQ